VGATTKIGRPTLAVTGGQTGATTTPLIRLRDGATVGKFDGEGKFDSRNFRGIGGRSDNDRARIYDVIALTNTATAGIF
jgi:hypothetical protein